MGELNHRVRARLEAEPGLRGLHVTGEISNFFRSGAGHVYFTLKDEGSEVRCVMWASRAGGLPPEVGDGVAIVVEADVTLYEVRGQYQLNVQGLRPAGEGLLWLRLEALRKRLDAEGLFDPARKRPLPHVPRRIGVVTSRDGAALQDILNVLRRRAPYVEVLLAHAQVQGRGAAGSLVAGLRRVVRADVDVVLLGRGGGSLEDLWAFNEEILVRAVAKCPIPVVSAVGHETDWALTDHAADLRAPTPSAAAEKIAPALTDLAQTLDHAEARIARHVAGRLELARHRLDALAQRPLLARPEALVAERRGRLAQASRRLPHAALARLSDGRHRLAALAHRRAFERPAALFAPQRDHVVKLAARLPRTVQTLLAGTRHAVERDAVRLPRAMQDRVRRGDAETRRLTGVLDALSPLKVLARGYSVTTRAGHVVRRVDDVKKDDAVTIRVADGAIDGRVTRLRRNPD